MSWDPPQPANDVVGYIVYYGPASQVYTNSVKIGTVCQSTVSGLVEGATYFFVVTAYNQAGLESKPSNEISYTVPTSTGNSPSKGPTAIPSLSLTPVFFMQTNPATGAQTLALKTMLDSNASTLSNSTSEACSLLVSTNLTDWTLLPDSHPWWTLELTNPGARFYRLRWP